MGIYDIVKKMKEKNNISGLEWEFIYPLVESVVNLYFTNQITAGEMMKRIKRFIKWDFFTEEINAKDLIK